MKRPFSPAIIIALAALAATPSAAQDSSSATCTAESLTTARNACDSLPGVSQLKCNNKTCHEALHVLTEDDTRECYATLDLGPITDLDSYVLLDEFCHGDGADPADQTVKAGPTNGTTSPSSGAHGTLIGDDVGHHDHDDDHQDLSYDHAEAAASEPTSASSSADHSITSGFLVVLQLVVLLAAVPVVW
uniref:Elicitin-like protein n=1 Tax=Peronospora matthiolae TaxID=2874970 RepID=A0AAV1TAN5_9STRA